MAVEVKTALTPALSPRRGGIVFRVSLLPAPAGLSRDCMRFPLSPGERAGVRAVISGFGPICCQARQMS